MDERLKPIYGKWKEAKNLWLDNREQAVQNTQEGHSVQERVSLLEETYRSFRQSWQVHQRAGVRWEAKTEGLVEIVSNT